MCYCESSLSYKKCKSDYFFAVQNEIVVSTKQMSARRPWLERHNDLSRIKQADKPSLKSLSASQVDAGEEGCTKCQIMWDKWQFEWIICLFWFSLGHMLMLSE